MKKHRHSGVKINKGRGQLDRLHVNLEDGFDTYNTVTVKADGSNTPPLDLDLSKYPELGLIVNDQTVSKEQRQKNAQDYLRYLIQRGDKLLSEKTRIDSEIVEHETTIADAKAKMAALTKLKEWVLKPAVLEKNDCSRAHKLAESTLNRKVISLIGDHVGGFNVNLDEAKSFVICHDWARAFQGASDYIDGEAKLPFPQCLFEFRISGRNVMVWAAQDEGIGKFDGVVGNTAAVCFVEVDGYWIMGETKDRETSHGILAWQTIRAVCIALDADVATHEVVREPSKLNAKRLRDGKAPLKPYHIVNLAKRHRVANQRNGTAGADYTHKRLHFRRGHWRHYEASKTWIKWCLVGDPDLGFVDKEYRL